CRRPAPGRAGWPRRGSRPASAHCAGAALRRRFAPVGRCSGFYELWSCPLSIGLQYASQLAGVKITRMYLTPVRFSLMCDANASRSMHMAPPPTTLVFPGQGSQRPGMGRDFDARFAASRRTYDEACDALGLDARALCFADDGRLALTEYAQPAI